MRLRTWIGPSLLTGILGAELIWVIARRIAAVSGAAEVSPKNVGVALYGPYLLGVEMASMLLLAGLIGAFHLGRGGLYSGTAADSREGKA